MKHEWLAIVERNLTCVVFPTQTYSKDVLYWIKRINNGKYHIAVSTGNKYELRDFEIYDKDLNPCLFSYGIKHKWECVDIQEMSLDAWGSRCFISVKDPKGLILNKIVMEGFYYKPHHGNAQKINEDFYFTSLILFLISLNKFTNWQDLKEQDSKLFDYIIDRGIPENFSKEAERINSKF